MRTPIIQGKSMASKKETKIKKISKKSVKKDVKKIPAAPVIEEVEENEEVEADIIGAKGKVKKPAEIDTADILPEVDEKIVDEENPLLVGEEEETDEEASLDDEDLNPFGDKWEQ